MVSCFQQAHKKTLNLISHQGTTMRHHFTPSGMVMIKKWEIGAGKGVGKSEHSCTAGGSVKWCGPVKTVAAFEQ